MKRVVSKIAYMGDGFCGSQIQPSCRTVESEVLDKLILVSGMSAEELDLKFSSRTDKGVNALGNAISFNSSFDDNATMMKAMNAVCKDVYFRSCCDVEDGFNVRFASSRVYRYVLPSEGMDMALAIKCSKMFLGEHDFARFCRDDGKPTTAKVDRIELKEDDGLVLFEFEARYFLWNMIRRIVSAIESVSKGTRTLDDVSKALYDLQETNFGVSRPDALTLLDVKYDWLDFIPADSDQFSERLKEESFRDGLRRTFFESL